MINRRNFLIRSSSAMAAAGSGIFQNFIYPWGNSGQLECDVAIIGGGVGGVAAALAALRNGLDVVLTEETDWIGGQLTQQAVPPDEHPWIEQFGATRSYREFRKAVRKYYKTWYPMTAEADGDPFLNPGSCSVSRICHEPRVALAVLVSMLASESSSGRLKIMLNSIPLKAETSGDRVEAVTLKNTRDGRKTTVKSSWFIDATETGELLPLTGTEYVSGSEARSQTGELHAADKPDPLNMQSITWCFAMDYREGEDHTIERPEQYGYWRDYVPKLDPPWPGKMLSWTYSQPVTLEPFTWGFDPRAGADNPGFWRYRRLIDPANFSDGPRNGITLVNWPMNDYLEGPVFELPEKEVARHLENARQQSLALLYWLQTEAPRENGKAGWPGLCLRKDITGTDHGLAKRPYIRESRRIKADFTVTENHIGSESRTELTGLKAGEVTAEQFTDSVGIGSYRIDLHPSTGGDNYIDISSLPFQVPLGALIPERMENLLPAAKNIGTTHITNGCYRLHPVEWNIGEAVGMLAAFCKKRSIFPRQAREKYIKEFQAEIIKQGIETSWPDPLRRSR